jgi:hypothetical protein
MSRKRLIAVVAGLAIVVAVLARVVAAGYGGTSEVAVDTTA